MKTLAGSYAVSIDESQRQLILLALAELALSRPGWEPAAIRPIVAELHGREMFVNFIRTSADLVCHRCRDNQRFKQLPGSLPMDFYEVTGYVEGKEVTLRYNVSAAFDFAVHTPVQAIPDEWARDLIFTNLSETFCGTHVSHIDPEVPALIGNFSTKLILMDGTHRMFRRLKDNKPAIAYILTEEQTERFAM